MKQLLNNASTNTQSESASYYGGMAWLIASGDFGGGSVVPQMQAPDGSWVDLIDSEMTAPGAQILSAPPVDIRLRLAGATNPSVSAWFG